MRASLTVLAFSTLYGLAYGYPESVKARDTPAGVVITLPPRPTDTGTKPIPDDDHPFIAPGAGDLRGPCPGLNTLANHGYLPRNGVASFEQIVNAIVEGFNMEYTLASALAALGMLMRGNAFVNQLSIGLPTSLVPPLPGNIDGPQALGLATHGRFEGDVSMTRSDALIGDNRNFNQTLFNELLALVAELGFDDPVTGPKSIVHVGIMQVFKFNRFVEDQKANRGLQYHIGRQLLSYGEASFTLNFFANGTTGLLSVPVMASFFKDQRFPANWHRHNGAAGFELVAVDGAAILATNPVPAGANNFLGIYVPDIQLNPDPICALYNNMAGDNVPAVLLNTTGILKQNVNTLLDAVYTLFSEYLCLRVSPEGPAGV